MAAALGPPCFLEVALLPRQSTNSALSMLSSVSYFIYH